MIHLIVLLWSSVCALASANGCATRLDVIELISDPAVTTGFRLIPGSTTEGDGEREVLNPFNDVGASKPAWTIQQWGSRVDLPVEARAVIGPGVRWDDGTKHVTLFADGTVELGVNGRADWQGLYPQEQPRRAAWPSLTLGHNITPPGATIRAPGGPLSEIDALRFTMTVRLSAFRADRHEPFDPGRNKTHAAAFVSIQNLHAGSPDYGRFIWFAIPIFDSTAPTNGPYSAADVYGDGLGTGMLIFTPGQTAFTEGTLWSGAWVRLEADLRPHVEVALAHALGKGLLTDADRAHYFVGGFTTGWETQGLDSAAFRFRDLSLRAYRGGKSSR